MFPLEFMKNPRKEERLESPPWQTEESISERGKGKPMQPITECPASQGDDGDFLALGPAGALEQEGQLFLLGAFANQARRPAVPPCPSFPCPSPIPSFPRRRESSIPPPFLDSRLRGNDGYFDRLVLKKTRGVHENSRGNVSLCPLSSEPRMACLYFRPTGDGAGIPVSWRRWRIVSRAVNDHDR
jgi:hypothetical protein